MPYSVEGCGILLAHMEKDFDGWNEKKKETQERREAPFYNQREIWWCTLGINVGFEQDGSGEEFRRPILILRGLSAHTCLAVPLTTSKRPHPLRPSIGTVDGKEAFALLSQLRVIDTKRLVRKIGRLETSKFKAIKKAARDVI